MLQIKSDIYEQKIQLREVQQCFLILTISYQINFTIISNFNCKIKIDQNKINKYISKVCWQMSTSAMLKAQNAMNQFTSERNLGNQKDALNQAAAKLGAQLSSNPNYNTQQGAFANTSPYGPTGQTGQAQGYSNPTMYQNQQFLSPNNAQAFTNTAPVSSPPNFGQLGYLQNNMQRILGTTAPQTYLTQSRIIQNQSAVRLPPINYNTVSNVSTRPIPTGQFNGTSKIQYVPYNKKIVQYQERQRKQVIPRARRVVQLAEQSKIQYIPREVAKIDYYAIERQKHYVPEYVPQVHINYVTRAVPYKRIQYVPVTRQVYHGAPLGGEGVTNLGMCAGVQMPMTAGSPWLNTFNPYARHGVGCTCGGMGGGVRGVGGLGMGGMGMGGMGGIGGIGGIGGGYRGIYGMYGGVIPYNSCDMFKRRVNNLYDNYQSYIPSFQY